MTMDADDHQDDEIKESMSDNEDDKDVKVRTVITYGLRLRSSDNY